MSRRARLDRACKRKAASEHSEDCELGSSNFEGYLDSFGSCTGLAAVGNGSVESGVWRVIRVWN